MFQRMGWKKSITALAGMAALLLAGGATFAQFPGGPPGPGQGPGGPPGPGGPGGPGRGFRPGGPGRRGMSLVDLPPAVLQAGLKLTDSQKTKIARIQEKFQQARKDLMPLPEEAPPDPESMRDNMEKLRSLHQQATKDIEAVLTTSQKKAIPTVLREIQALRMAGIPAELLGTLKLSDDQRKQIASIVQQAQQETRQKMDAARQSGDRNAMRDIMEQSRQDIHDKAMAVLTDDQKAQVEKFVAEHPLPPGGPGFGPPPGGPGDGPPAGGPPAGPPPDAPPPPGDPDGAPPPPAPDTF